MSIQTFRAALGSRLGEVITPELAAWLEDHAFDRVDLSHAPEKFGVQVYRGMTFQVERVAAIRDELEVLHQAHYLETEIHRNNIPLDMNYELLQERERAGSLVQFTARSEAGALVGNIRMYVYTSVHTKTLEAKEDTIFMLAEHRKGFNSVRFMQYAMDGLKAIGVLGIYTDSKLANKIDRFNEYLGFHHVSDGWYKFLGE